MAPIHLDSELATKLVESIGRLEGTLDGMAVTQEKIYKAIYGNGQPGLMQRIGVLEAKGEKTDGLHERLETLERKDSEVEGGKKALTNRRLLVTSAIGSTTAFLGMLYHLLH